MLSQKPWKGEPVLLLVCALFVANGLGGLAVGVIEKFGGGMPEARRQLAETVAQMISLQGGALVLVASFLAWQKIRWTDAFGLKSSTLSRVISFGIIAGIVVIPVAWFLQELSASLLMWFQVDTGPQPIVQKLQSPEGTVVHKWFWFFTAVIAAPVVEEILFRGILYPTIKQLKLPRVAFWGTAALFAASHFNTQTFLPLLFFAVILTLLYEKTDNLLTPIIAHSTFNAVNFVLIVFFRDSVDHLIHKFV